MCGSGGGLFCTLQPAVRERRGQLHSVPVDAQLDPQHRNRSRSTGHLITSLSMLSRRCSPSSAAAGAVAAAAGATTCFTLLPLGSSTLNLDVRPTWTFPATAGPAMVAGQGYAGPETVCYNLL